MQSDMTYVTLSLGHYLYRQKVDLEHRIRAMRATIQMIEKDEVGATPMYRGIYEWKKRTIFADIKECIKLYEVVSNGIIKTKIELRSFVGTGTGKDAEIMAYLHSA